MSSQGFVNRPLEISLRVDTTPQRDGHTEIDIAVSGPAGEMRIPAFRASGDEFRARFAAPAAGRHRWRAALPDARVPVTPDRGEIDIRAYEGPCALYRHGRLRVAASQRTLEHADGTPFFWLGDTWWAGCVGGFRWPEDVERLTADRVAKGFSVIQLVAGMLPWCPGDSSEHPRQGNEGGTPWEAGWSRINPAYYDEVDVRIAHLVESGLVPCIFAMWSTAKSAMRTSWASARRTCSVSCSGATCWAARPASPTAPWAFGT